MGSPLRLFASRSGWRCVLAMVLASGIAIAQSASADARAAALRATVLLKLAPYVPSDATVAKGKPYRIGVVGKDAVATAVLRELPGKTVEQATVTVAELTPNAAAQGTDAFELLCIADSVDDVTLACIVAAHREKPVVLVCERPGFAALGGGVQLFVKDNCVRFEINGEALKRQGLRPSAQVLKLSRKGPCP